MTTTSAILPSYDHGAGDRPLLGETIGPSGCLLAGRTGTAVDDSYVTAHVVRQ